MSTDKEQKVLQIGKELDSDETKKRRSHSIGPDDRHEIEPLASNKDDNSDGTKPVFWSKRQDTNVIEHPDVDFMLHTAGKFVELPSHKPLSIGASSQSSGG